MNYESMPNAGNQGGLAVTESGLIQVRGVTRVYRQGTLEVHALRGVDMDLDDGEFTALVGPSGSGKTTLLNLIGVLDKPDSGTITVAGQDVSQFDRGEAAEFRLDTVGFIFQAYNLVPVLTAYENAEFTLLLRGVPTAERRTRVMSLLDRVGLADTADRKPHELSGGQQQRVAVVRALATEPRLVLADEPTANLDSETSAELMELMRELNGELRTTFLFSTHDPVVLQSVTSFDPSTRRPHRRRRGRRHVMLVHRIGGAVLGALVLSTALVRVGSAQSNSGSEATVNLGGYVRSLTGFSGFGLRSNCHRSTGRVQRRGDPAQMAARRWRVAAAQRSQSTAVPILLIGQRRWTRRARLRCERGSG